MAVFRNVAVAGLLGWLFVAGCENAEERARYVKEPLESADLSSRGALNQAVTEAKTRLASVRSDTLRADLSSDIDGTYERALAQIGLVEQAEAARKALEAERKLEAERARAAAEALEAERKREAERNAEAERETLRPNRLTDSGDDVSQEERRRAALENQQKRAKEAVTELEVRMRDSVLGDGTRVLVLRNAKPYPVSFNLRCYTAGDTASKDFAVSIPAGGERRIGFVQGWNGNFKGGERCEAYLDGELLWNYEIP